MEQRADCLWDSDSRRAANTQWVLSEHADDAIDIEVLKHLRAMGLLRQHKTSPPPDPRKAIMVGLGLALQASVWPANLRPTVQKYATRGHSEVVPGSSPSSMVVTGSKLVANSQNTVAVDEDLFRWLHDRQGLIYGTLLAIGHCYLSEHRISANHLLAPMIAHTSSATISDAQIKRQLKELAARERTHAVALAQVAAAQAFLDEEQQQDAQVRLTVAIQLLCETREPNFALLSRAATMLAKLARTPTAKQTSQELGRVLKLTELPTVMRSGLTKALEDVKALLPAPIEYRKCSFCAHEKQRDEFSKNQWLKGKRRCFTCQGSNVQMTPEQLAEAADRAAENKEMQNLYEAEVARQQERVAAECTRRNEVAPTDNQCVICFEEWGSKGGTSMAQPTCRATLPCSHPVCATCLFKIDPCRCPLCLKDIGSARLSTCVAVAEADESLRELSRHLPLDGALQVDVLVRLLQASRFEPRDWGSCDWRSNVEERLWDMVAALPHAPIETSAMKSYALTTEQKQQIYRQARRPVEKLRRRVLHARGEGSSPEAVAELERQLSIASKDAAADIFAQMNADGLQMGEARNGTEGGEEIWQDFHGLHVDEATTKLMQLLDDVLPAIGTLVIVTGRGAHSPDQSAKLRQALERTVSKRAATVEATPLCGNPGAIRLRARKGDAK